MSKPITPEEAKAKHLEEIMPEVFESFNELIVKNLCNRYSSFKQKEVEKLVVEKLKGKQFYSKMLNVEEAYRKVGWKVVYDRPGYNESYDATFSFTAP